MNKKLQKEFENSYEYVLPDYMGDVKKLLTSNAVASVSGKFVGEGTLEVSGAVEYSLLYVDAEGKLTPISVLSDYSETFSVDSEKYIDSKEESRVLGLRVRVTGPRKIMLRADLQTSLTVRESENIGDYADGINENQNLEKCCCEVKYANSLFLKSGEKEYAEILEKLDSEATDDVEIISSSACVKVDETTVTSGKAIVKGELTVSSIISSDDSAPRLVKKSFPFEEAITSEDIKSGMTPLADATVISASVAVGADGEGSALVANAVCEYTLELLENNTSTVITDAYAVSGECKTSYENLELSELIWAGTEAFTVDLKREKAKENLTDLGQIISMNSQISVTGAKLHSGECELSGQITVNGVGFETNVDGSQTYIPIKIQDEFSEKVKIGCQNTDKIDLDYQLSIIDTDVVCDADSLMIKCYAVAKISLYKPKTVSVLTSCEVIDEPCTDKPLSKITVYYPKAGDRLFDVAKKYKTTSQKIAKDNQLSESALASYDTTDSLVGIKKLIIC